MTIEAILLVVAILFIHWVADFLCQTHYMSINKSKHFEVLLMHTLVYSLVWLIPVGLFFQSLHAAGAFVVITLIAHTVTDYFTSRLNSKLWKENEVHWFFVSIGFDQFLHFAQLLTTFYFIQEYVKL